MDISLFCFWFLPVLPVKELKLVPDGISTLAALGFPAFTAGVQLVPVVGSVWLLLFRGIRRSLSCFGASFSPVFPVGSAWPGSLFADSVSDSWRPPQLLPFYLGFLMASVVVPVGFSGGFGLDVVLLGLWLFLLRRCLLSHLGLDGSVLLHRV